MQFFWIFFFFDYHSLIALRTIEECSPARRMQFHYFDVDTDFVDETRVVNGADCVQLHMASNMRTITVCARVNILPRLNPFIMEFPNGIV